MQKPISDCIAHLPFYPTMHYIVFFEIFAPRIIGRRLVNLTQNRVRILQNGKSLSVCVTQGHIPGRTSMSHRDYLREFNESLDSVSLRHNRSRLIRPCLAVAKSIRVLMGIIG
jgi:hypothetical protein